jgi:hypothetical protein
MPNCKPNELAVIVAERPLAGENIGAIVRVIEPGFDKDGIRCWTFAEASRPLVCTDFHSTRIEGYITESGPFGEWVLEDAHLIPIRDPDNVEDSETETERDTPKVLEEVAA